MPGDTLKEPHQGRCRCKLESLVCIVWTNLIRLRTATQLLEMGEKTFNVNGNPLSFAWSKAGVGGPRRERE